MSSVELAPFPFPYPVPDMGTTEETPPKPWRTSDVGCETDELERAYEEALRHTEARRRAGALQWGEDTIPSGPPEIEADVTRAGPLVPDEYLEEPLPSDARIVAAALGYKRLIVFASLAMVGLALGVGTALLL